MTIQMQEQANAILPQWLPLCKKENITGIGFLHRGKRSIVFKGTQEKKEVVLKIPNPLHDVTARLRIEADMLRRVNTFGLGPVIVSAVEHKVRYYFI